MPKKNNSLNTRVVVLEEHIAVLNEEMGKVDKNMSILTDNLLNPETGLCLKIDRLNEKVKTVDQKVGQYKWYFLSLIVPLGILVISEILRRGAA